MHLDSPRWLPPSVTVEPSHRVLIHEVSNREVVATDRLGGERACLVGTMS